MVLQRNSKLTLRILTSVVLRERTHPGFHGSTACEAMSSSVRLMMIIYMMISTCVARVTRFHTKIMHLISSWTLSF
jgi:hypothetical protein